MFKNLITSRKVSLYFSIFSFISLLILLIAINIIYFFIWYNSQENAGMYDMNINYESYSKDGMNKSNIQSFKDYVLTKESIIIGNNGDTVCSPSLNHKNLGEIDILKNKLLVKYEGKIYLIFSKKYNEIGVVKILFDTTPYIESQIIIIKISLFIILFSVLLNYLLGEIAIKKSLKNLELIKNYSKKLDLNSDFKELIIDGPDNDEIKIVANILNESLKKIKSQNDNLKQFISDVSHEIKTPLMAINSKSDLFLTKIEKQKYSENDLIDFVNYNKLYVKKIDKILGVLFLITRIKNKNLKLKIEEVNLNKHIENIINEKEINNIEIIGELTIKLDLAIFDIIFENLLNNAIKYGNNKKIIIELNTKYLRIKDSGIGIEKEKLEKIWDNFYKIDPESNGFGIGLYLVKRLIELCNWNIKVKSEIGIGSEFIIKF